jgi:pectate lyase
MRPSSAVCLITLIALGAMCASAALAGAEDTMQDYLNAVVTFADNALQHAHDVYGPKKTPLFVDWLNLDTLEPPRWRRDGEDWILCNLASQQNLFRTLIGLSAATGDPKYRQAAVDATRYVFENLQDVGGLLRWGGHTCYDALGDRVVSEAKQHELKHHYPYYELMWEIDPEATRRYIEGLWAAHVIRWDILDFNRHGRYGESDLGRLWEHEYTGGKVPFEGKGLTFMMSGTDLVYAAAMLSHFTGDEKPMTWAKRLASRYVEARHPETGLGASNFSVLESHRMENQFPQFEGRFTEATVTDIYGARYTYCAICQLRLGEALGDKGKEFLRWGFEDLTARAKHGYEEESNSFWAMLIDGTRLSPADRKKDGYVTTEWLQKRAANSAHFLAYALAYKLTRDDLMRRMTSSIARGLGLGELLPESGRVKVNTDTASGDPVLIFGLLELHAATREKAYLDLARRIADNAIATRVRKGFFVESRDHLCARLDDPTPLALLHLGAVVLGLPQRPPTYWHGRGYFHCPFDGEGRTYDNSVFGALRRSQGDGE